MTTVLPEITPHLRKGEAVLWSGKPDTPDSLRAYRGWHTWVGRLMVGVAIAMGLIAWANRAEITSVWVWIILVGGPSLIAVGFAYGVAWLMRDSRRTTRYAVTQKRVLVVTKTGPISTPITRSSDIKHTRGRKGYDTVQFAKGNHVNVQTASNKKRSVYSQPKAFILKPDDAADAYRALQISKAKAK